VSWDEASGVVLLRASQALTDGPFLRLRRISVPRAQLDLGEVELVETDKLLSDSAARVLARIVLPGQARRAQNPGGFGSV